MTEQTSPTAPQSPSNGVTRGMLIWFGVGIVVLSFVAAFLGAWLGRDAGADAADSPTPTSTPTASVAPDYEAILDEILPAGAAVRAGTGAPEPGKGYEGEAYIDILTSDVYLFRDGDWTWVANIRTAAAENLTGEAGPEGPSGPTGEPGAPGTQLLLGLGAPDGDTCEADGDVYIDTEDLVFYECSGGEWMLFGPTPTPTPSPTS
ncbi:hypothetical protein GCM10022200_10170 [Microbacterium awajiense]|uniref:Collagen triple helix repeat protein n=1 Tax=Microbacterium awajiense TaxID=415214 RepID=A0ABP7ACP3_9MICO